MSTYRLELQYLGTAFHGWSSQPGLPTVRSALEKALAVVLGSAPLLTVAGRTDSGVHARRQVVSVTLSPVQEERLPEPRRFMHSLNALTPPAITVFAAAPAATGFDARRHSLSRSYRYFVSIGEAVSPSLHGLVWHVRFPVDLGCLDGLAALLPGRHDFSAFTPTVTEHVYFHRHVFRARWRVRRSLAFFEIEADAFMRHMVRALVGTMMEVARGSMVQEDFVRLLEGAPRPAAGPTAPPQGLFFWDVRYPEAWVARPTAPPLLGLLEE